MSELIRKRVIRDLTNEITDLDATSIEIVGHKVIETLEGTKLVHHGINKDYKPVGYTVDTFSQDFSIVGEYSTEDGFFDGSKNTSGEYEFTKIAKDVRHAFEKGGKLSPSRIYLVSSEEEPPSFRGKFNQTDLAKAHGGRLVFLDARELAKIIFDSSTQNSQAADFYRNYLPDFSQNLDNYEYYGRVPPVCANHQPIPIIIDAIADHFQSDKNICVLHGLSGSGKTQAAIDFVRTALPNFGNYIWIAGDDWKDGVPLTAIKRSRGGVPINVAGVFNASKTLLVIDDLSRRVSEESFVELRPGFELGGKVLLTSQLVDPTSPNYLQIPQLPQPAAYRILGEDEATASEIASQFIDKCLFCPLILAVTRKVSEIDGIERDELYREVLSMPGVAQGDDGRPIMARILGKVNDADRVALEKIAKSGCTTFDATFLSKFIGPSARAGLQRLAILNRTATSSTLSVHDLICSAASSGEKNGQELAQALEKYVAKNCGEMVPSVVRQIHLSTQQLLEENTARGRRNPDWLTYALLQVERGKRAELLGDLHECEIRSDMPIAELLCIIDSKEAYSYSLSQEDRKIYYEGCAEEYGQVAQKTGDPDIRAEMLHHQGKALRRCGQLEPALACFQSLLRERPEWHAAYGQIAHLGIQREADKQLKTEGERALQFLIDELLKDLDSVPLRVSLAALSRLRSYPSITDWLVQQPKYVKQLADVVTLSAVEGFDQFYEGFLGLTSLFNYHHPGICLSVAESFPDMVAIYPNSVEERQWVNACEALSNILITAKKQEQHDLARKLSAAAESFATELSLSENQNSYKVRVVAKTFLSVGAGEKALQAIKGIPEDSRDHWLLYRQSKIEADLQMLDDALETAERALKLALQDPKAERRLSIYHDQISQCYERLGQVPRAIESLKEAIGLVTDEKYGNRLSARLSELEAVH
ncbi:tetratricopeptide repeat protein [Marinobacter maritimus]|uniref:tetratricopeptide repeat protein n=1 Tax=Marinobacter maritimus TaxID=277961 RepID=UPI0011A389D8|nr:tetratricopeptide repeat protein [Marinobacter maritimus]